MANPQLQFVLSVNNGQFTAALQQAGNTLQTFGGQLNAVNGQLTLTQQTMQATAAATLALQANVASFGIITGSIFRDAFEGFKAYEVAVKQVVKVTAQLTQENLPALDSAIRSIGASLPIANTEILAIGQNLAQMGFFAQETEKTLVPAMTNIIKLVSKVAAATDLSAEEAGAAFGVLRNVFLDTSATAQEATRALAKFADVANYLSNTTSATAGYIVRFNTLIGSTGKAAGFTYEQLSGFGAAVAKLGISANVAGTALQRFFQLAITKADLFGKVVGKSGDDFKKAYAKAPNEAIVDFLDKLSKKSSEYRTSILTQIGLEQRATTIVSGLANNTKLLAEAQAGAVKASKEGVSVDNEVAVAVSSLSAQLEILANTLSNALTQAFVPFAAVLKPIITTINAVTAAFPGLVAVLGFVTVAAAGAAAAVATFVTVSYGWQLAGASLIQGFRTVGTALVTFSAQLFGAQGAMSSVVTQGLLPFGNALKATGVAILNFSKLLLNMTGWNVVGYFKNATNAVIAFGVAVKQAFTGATLTGFITSIKAAGIAIVAAMKAGLTAIIAMISGLATARTGMILLQGAAGGFAIALALVIQAMVGLSSKLNDVDNAMKELGDTGGATLDELTANTKKARKALDEYRDSWQSKITFGLGTDDAEKNLAAAEAALKELEATYRRTAETITNPPVGANGKISDFAAKQKEVFDKLVDTTTASADEIGAAINLVTQAFNKSGGKASTAAFLQVAEKLKLTADQTASLAVEMDKVLGKTAGAQNSLTKATNESAGATLAEVEAMEASIAANAALTKIVDDRKTKLEATLKTIKDLAVAQSTRTDGDAIAKQKQLDDIREASATRQKQLVTEIAVIEAKLADAKLQKDPGKTRDAEALLLKLKKEQLNLEKDTNAAIEATNNSVGKREAIFNRVAAANADARLEAKKQAVDELEKTADLTTDAAKRIAIERQVLTARLAIIAEESAAEQLALDQKFAHLGEKKKLDIEYANTELNIRLKTANKIKKAEDDLQSKLLKKRVDANKEIRKELAARQGGLVRDNIGGNESDKGAGEGAIDAIRVRIKETLQGDADHIEKLQLVARLEQDIANEKLKATDKVTTAERKLSDFKIKQAEAESDKIAEIERKAAEEEAKARIGIVDTALDINKQKQNGEITAKQAARAIAAAKDKLAIDTLAAKFSKDGVVDDKERKTLTDARKAALDAEFRAAGKLKTPGGREELALRKLKIDEEAKLADIQQNAAKIEEDKRRKARDDAKELTSLQNELNVAQIQSANTNAAAGAARLAIAQQLLEVEKQISAEKEAGNTGTATGATPAAPTAARAAPPPVPTVPPAAPLPAAAANNIAGVGTAATALTAALSAAGNNIVNAATALTNTANAVGTSIGAFTDQTTKALGEITVALTKVNTKVDRAVVDIRTVTQALNQIAR